MASLQRPFQLFANSHPPICLYITIGVEMTSLIELQFGDNVHNFLLHAIPVRGSYQA